MNPEDRRQHLLEVAAVCVAEHGTTVSMDRIADAAQISKPLMRHYFGNRDGLLMALFDRDVASIVEIFTQRDRGTLVERLDEYLTYIRERPWAHRLWMVALTYETVLSTRVHAARVRLMESSIGLGMADQDSMQTFRANGWLAMVERLTGASMDLARGGP